MPRFRVIQGALAANYGLFYLVSTVASHLLY